MTAVPTLILGAAGRDFHNFNVAFRDDSSHRVVAFTAQQIPNIADRRYPAELAGALYPEGMHLASRANATGADFSLLGVERTSLRSRLPVVAVVASRTGGTACWW